MRPFCYSANPRWRKCSRPARGVAAPDQAIYRDQLRGDSRSPAGKRVVRLRARRFHGANKQTPGRIETAHQGTLFLDEIGDLPGALQAKLLRFCRSERSSGSAAVKRFRSTCASCATHQNLRERITAARSAKTCFTGSPRSSSPFRRCAAAGGRCGAAGPYTGAAFRRRLEARPARHQRRKIAAVERHRWPGNVRELET
jgi:two-component system NtrC family response regulator